MTASQFSEIKVISYTSKIIQILLRDCFEIPEEFRVKLRDRQAILQHALSELEFSGRIRDSLRQFGCVIGHPRGFAVQNIGDNVEITKYISTGFPHVIIPQTFFNPPLPIKIIGENAFMGDKTLGSVVI